VRNEEKTIEKEASLWSVAAGRKPIGFGAPLAKGNRQPWKTGHFLPHRVDEGHALPGRSR